jgi:hypothetical protein
VRSNKTGTYCLAFDKEDSPSTSFVKEFTINSADTWEKKEIVVTPDSQIKGSDGAIANDNGRGIRVFIGLAWGTDYHRADGTWGTGTGRFATSNQVNWLDSTSNNFYLTGLQVEVGEQATPFEHRSFADELSRCQRYFQHWNLGGTYQNGGGFSAMLYSSSLTFGTIPFMCEMRAAPTGSISAANTWQFLNSSDAPHSVNTISIYAASKVSASFQCDPSTASSTPNVSETGGGLLWPGNTNSNDATVSMDAEL